MTETLKPKNVVVFRKFSVCDFLFVSAKWVLVFSFLTNFGNPNMISIYFSIMKGETDVTAFSSIDFITRNVAKCIIALEDKVRDLFQVVI